jgi:hypothetical protein
MLTCQKTNSRQPKQFSNFRTYSAHITTSLPSNNTEPTCYTRAIKFAHWHEAMAQELNALVKNQT